jgi:transposase
MKDIVNQVYESNEEYLLNLTKPAIAMDRGIATKDNLDYLKQHNYSYFIIERRNTTKLYKEEFSDIKETGISYETKSKQTIYLKRIEEENCTRVLVYSPQKMKKEDGIIGKKEERYLADVNRLMVSVKKRTLKDEKKIHIRIGRIMERYGAIASLYEIKLVKDNKKKGNISDIKLEKKNKPVVVNKKKDLPGCYVIETNRKDIETEEIWEFYMTLHEVESAFRAIKSDLGTRPIYHQLDSRIESHLFISVLAYSIMKSILFSLREKGKHNASWTSVRQTLSNHMRGTTIQTSKSGDIYHTRVTGIPESGAQEIYDLLDIPVKTNRKILKIENQK